MVGLFVKSPFRRGPNGEYAVAPIVRFGKIALEETEAAVYMNLGDEDDPTKAKSVRAILVESISFQGESGSPVFSYLEHTRDPDAGSKAFYEKRHWAARPVRLTDGEVSTPLIGMVSSHWKIDSKVEPSYIESTGRTSAARAEESPRHRR